MVRLSQLPKTLPVHVPPISGVMHIAELSYVIYRLIVVVVVLSVLKPSSFPLSEDWELRS